MDIKKITIRRYLGKCEPFVMSLEELSGDKKERSINDFDMDGSVLHTRIIKYDDNGRPVFREDSYPKENISNIVKTEYLDLKRTEREFFMDGGNNKTVTTFDKNGNVISVEKFEDEDSDTPFESSRYSYNEKGDIKSSHIVDNENNIIESVEYTYNEKGRLSCTQTERQGAVSRKINNYDEKERLIEVTSDGVNSDESSALIKYNDEDGTREEVINQGLILIIQKFNSKNLMVYQERKSQVNLHKIATSKITYEYGDNGLLESIDLNDDSNPMNSYRNRFEYEFFGDIHG
jgi:uncharacterized protein YkuJ